MAGFRTSTAPSENPFVGPRPFETGEHLFGREREITELYYLLSSERIVLLHSPSGAGKSSMIQAGLLPKLRERFDVWRPTRVNLPLPTGTPSDINRYVLSSALGFEQGIPEDLRRSPEQLTGMTLIECVRTRKRRPSAPASVLLIFDQFEEILTIDPLQVEAKQQFFDQLGELLRASTYWALFAMREDYLAPLDPYTEQVPTHLQNRYRIDLLSLDEAREAIARPSEEEGRTFEPSAVEKLLSDLATQKVQRSDGSFENRTGLHVEPLHLQVVCRGLWERLAPEKRNIGVEDVAQLGNVTEALSKYYAAEVARIAIGNEAVEREMRDWISDKLITADGTRGQVIRGAGKSEGLDNALVAMLVDTHLLRAEQRAGAIWYELAHDRLIEPIRDNNLQWRDAHLNQVQKRASVWAAQGRPDGLLLLGTDLIAAQQWSEEQGQLTDNEHKFLDASARAQASEARQQRQQRRILWLAVASMIATVVSGFALWNSTRQSRRANDSLAAQTTLAETLASTNGTLREREKQAVQASAALRDALKVADNEKAIAEQQRTHAVRESQIALASQLLAQAGDTLTQRPDLLPLSTLLALESMNRDKSVEADEFLRHSLSWLRPELGQPITQQGISTIMFSPDGRSIATAGIDGTVKVSDALTGSPRFAVTHSRTVESVAFSADGRYLATASIDGTARIWDANTGQSIGEPFPLKWTSGVISVCFSPSGRYIATSSGSSVSVWELSDNLSPKVNSKVEDSTSNAAVSYPTFTPDGKYLIAVRNNTMKLWEVDSWKESDPIILGRSPATRSARPILALAHDGKSVVIDQSIYEVPSGNKINSGTIDGIDPMFSPDGSYFATSSGDTVSVWAYPFKSGGKALANIRVGGGNPRVKFSPQRGYIATAGNDHTARLWRIPNNKNEDAREVARLIHNGSVSLIAFNPDGTLLATSESNTVRLWKMADDQEGITTYKTIQDTSRGQYSAISADGRFVVYGNSEVIKVMRASDGAKVSEFTLPDSNSGRKLGAFDISADGQYIVATITQDKPTSIAHNGTPIMGSVEVARQIWDRLGKTTSRPIESKSPSKVFMFSPDGRYLATGNDDEYLDVRDTQTGNRVSIPPIKIDLSINSNFRFFFTSNGKYLAIAGSDNKVHLLDTGTWTDRHPLQLGASIGEIVASENGEYLAASTEGPTESDVQIWQISDLKLRAQIVRKTASGVTRNTAIALSPDGESLATADWSSDIFSNEPKVLLWSAATSRLIGTLPLKYETHSLAFSHDGRYLGIGTAGGLSVRDQQEDQDIATVETPGGSQIAVFSPDGRYLLSIDDFNAVSAWFWASSRVAEAVCSKLTINLSEEEWAQYLPGEPYRKTCPNLPVPGGVPLDVPSASHHSKPPSKLAPRPHL